MNPAHRPVFAEQARARARDHEYAAALYGANRRILLYDLWGRVTPELDDHAETFENMAHRAGLLARRDWLRAWAFEHCVEHEDCRAHPELAVACLAGGD